MEINYLGNMDKRIKRHIRQLPNRPKSVKWNRRGLYRSYIISGIKDIEEIPYNDNLLAGFSSADRDYGLDKIYFEVLDKICGHDIRFRKLKNISEIRYLAIVATYNEFREEIYRITGDDYGGGKKYIVSFFDWYVLKKHIMIFNKIMSMIHESTLL